MSKLALPDKIYIPRPTINTQRGVGRYCEGSGTGMHPYVRRKFIETAKFEIKRLKEEIRKLKIDACGYCTDLGLAPFSDVICNHNADLRNTTRDQPSLASAPIHFELGRNRASSGATVAVSDCKHVTARHVYRLDGAYDSYCEGCGVEVAASGVDGGSWVPWKRSDHEPTPPPEVEDCATCDGDVCERCEGTGDIDMRSCTTCDGSGRLES